MAKCPETIEELEELIQLIPLCKRDLYERAQAKIKSGAAYSLSDAARQIAEETGRSKESIRVRIQEGKRQAIQSVHPVQFCEIEEQADSIPSYTIPHVAQNTGDNEWYTPPEFIEAALNLMGEIDCDPASSEIANQTIKAKKFYTISQDGRDKEWGNKVWMNPPYAQPLIADFSTGIVDRYESGEVKEACVLVNNATETNWFQNMLGKASAVVFIKSRVRFLDPEGNPGAPLQGQCILYFGDNSKDFYEEFNKFGIVLFHAEPF